MQAAALRPTSSLRVGAWGFLRTDEAQDRLSPHRKIIFKRNIVPGIWEMPQTCWR